MDMMSISRSRRSCFFTFLHFKHKIACFTETPIIALGAFVAISKRRADEKRANIKFLLFSIIDNDLLPKPEPFEYKLYVSLKVLSKKLPKELVTKFYEQAYLSKMELIDSIAIQLFEAS
ncbi:TPA: hypothetical protein RQJ74_003197 [Vibrio vulnificus]|nr:hypothetical protein [Vibrio vulnificus]